MLETTFNFILALAVISLIASVAARAPILAFLSLFLWTVIAYNSPNVTVVLDNGNLTKITDYETYPVMLLSWGGMALSVIIGLFGMWSD